MTVFEASSNAGKPPENYGIPERLAKHTVRYADYREVNRDDMTPMMRHYAEIKDQHPYALLMYRVGDFFLKLFFPKMPLLLPVS